MVASKSSAAQPTTTRKPGGFLFQHPDAERLTHQLADAMGLTGAARDDLRHRLEHDIQNLGDFLGFTPGMVIAEVQQQPVTNATELQKRVDQLKKDGKKAVVLLVVSPDGDPSFVAISLQ